MNRTIQPAPVRKRVRVPATPARAFDVFAGSIGRWWPKTHHIGAAALQSVVIEPRVGGRWFERDVDGAECEIGRVLAWEPPSRLVLAWQLNAQFKFDAELLTEVEVRFLAEGPNSTLVELEHRHLERLGAAGPTLREQIDSPNGWGALLGLYAEFLARQPS